MRYDKPKTIVARYNGFKPLNEMECETAIFPNCLTQWGVSRHIQEHRQSRFDAMQINAGVGSCVAKFRVMRNNRVEIHRIFDNGIITTHNECSTIVTTFMFGRPEQIREYWIGCGEAFPYELNYLLKVADQNQYLAWHN